MKRLFIFLIAFILFDFKVNASNYVYDDFVFNVNEIGGADSYSYVRVYRVDKDGVPLNRYNPFNFGSLENDDESRRICFTLGYRNVNNQSQPNSNYIKMYCFTNKSFSGFNSFVYNNETLYYKESGTFGYWFSHLESDCNFPIFLLDDFGTINGSYDLTSGLNDVYEYLFNGLYDNDVRNLADKPISPDELGYLTDVKYFVDSAAYQYNPADSPEFIQWGNFSTTGIDLTDSRYSVEFVLEDTSSYYYNSYLNYVPNFNLIAEPVKVIQEIKDYVAGLVYPSGSVTRAVLQNKALKTSFNGNFISIGSTSASNKQYRFTAVNSYLNGLSSDINNEDEYAFRNFLQGYSDNPSNGYIGHMVQNLSQLGKVFSMSYNILARIVDNNSEAKGNWLKIDRHNTPYWDGDSDERLNGGFTLTNGHKYTVNNFGDTFTSPGEKDQNVKTKPEYLSTGYWNTSNNNGDIIYNNYTYIYNNYGGDTNVNNIVYPDFDGNETNGSSNLLETLGILGWMSVLLGWYSILFGDILPVWAQLCIPVFGLMFTVVLVYKFGRSLIT